MGAPYMFTRTVISRCDCDDVTIPAGTVMDGCDGGCPAEEHKLACSTCGRVICGGVDDPLPLVRIGADS